MKRKICLVLAMLMIFSVAAVLVSCGDKGDQGGASTTVTTVPGGTGPTDSHLYEDLPTGAYDGYEFKTLNGKVGYSIDTIVPEDTTDSLDAAIYARNAFVKEKLGITMTDLYADGVEDTMKSLTSSNDFEYDVVFNRVEFQIRIVPLGTYLPVDDYEEYLNFDKPWWFTDAMDSIKVDGRGFELFSDMHLAYYDSVWAMAFNHSDLINNKQSFPYDLVRSGDWDIEELEKIVKATYNKPGEEHYGITSHAGSITAFMVASDFRMVEQDDDLVLKMFEDETRFVEIYTAIKNAFFTSNGPGKTNIIRVSAKSNAAKQYEGYEVGWVESFTNGSATFMAGTIGDLRAVRSSSFDYGFVPMPKYDGEQQDQYIGMIHNGASSAGIPTTQPDVERTCVILENLAAYSYKLVKYEYYDVVVQGRSVRDNDSIEMLDIAFGVDEDGLGTTRFVIDKVFIMDLSVAVEREMSDANEGVLVTVDGLRGGADSRIEEIIENYK